MVYALNVFNLLPDREEAYRRYSVGAGRIIKGVGGRVVAAGRDPLRELHGDLTRRYMIVVEFPGEDAFQDFLDEADKQALHNLREGATTDYIWTLYEPWDLKAWVNQKQDKA